MKESKKVDVHHRQWNQGETPVSVVIVGVLRFDNPQPHQHIRFSADLGIPVHKGTRAIQIGE